MSAFNRRSGKNPQKMRLPLVAASYGGDRVSERQAQIVNGLSGVSSSES